MRRALPATQANSSRTLLTHYSILFERRERKLYCFYHQKEAIKTLSSLFANECDLGKLTFAPHGVVPEDLPRNSGI